MILYPWRSHNSGASDAREVGVYHPTTRVLVVLELLQAHGRMSGPDLAARLEVDLRTVRRYVTMLQDLGIPVEAERGRHGGYRLRPGFRLPPLMLTDDEALAVTLGLLAARRLGLATAAPAVEGALAKLERALPPDVRQRVAAVQGTLTMDLTPHPVAAPSSIVIALSGAAQDEHPVWIRYASARGDETERVIDPYGLVHLGGRWYAAGFCHLRQGLRVFRLDRVRSLVVQDGTFARPPGFDSLAFVQASLADAPSTWLVEALLDTDLDDARVRVRADQATLEPTDGGVLIRLNTECLDSAARFLVGIGCPFAVREPPELKDALRFLAREIADAALPSG